MKRDSASDRVPMMPRPPRRSSSASGGRGESVEETQQAPGDRLDRRERVVDLVAQHAHETLPGEQLLLAQRLAQVRHHDERVRASVLPERRAAHLPPAAASGKDEIVHARRVAGEERGEA